MSYGLFADYFIASLSLFMVHFFSLSTLKRRLRAMNIRRHDELIGPNDVIEAVSVSYLNERPTIAYIYSM